MSPKLPPLIPAKLFPSSIGTALRWTGSREAMRSSFILTGAGPLSLFMANAIWEKDSFARL